MNDHEQKGARQNAAQVYPAAGRARLQQPPDARPPPATHAHPARAEIPRPGGGAQGVVADIARTETKGVGASRQPCAFPSVVPKLCLGMRPREALLRLSN